MSGSSPIATVLDRLEGVKKSGQGYMARCPAHEDRRQSLSVSEGNDGRVLLCCHAGCETETILAALGLESRDLFAEGREAGGDGDAWTPHGPAVATYTYTDEEGRHLFTVCRTADKKFPCWHSDPAKSHGKSWSMEGIRRVPYHLPKVVEEAGRGGIIHVAEGEKDVEALEKAGAVATCNPGGAGKWKPEYAEYLCGAHVIVVAHRDEPGRKHAAAVAASLQGEAASVVIVEAVEGNDAADHLAAGYGLEDFSPVDLQGVSIEAATRRLEVLTASELLTMTPERPEWIAEPLVARSCISDLVAGPKVGKSTLALALAAAVTEGRLFVGKPTNRTGVLYLTEERGPTFRAALERVGLVGDGLRIILRRAGAGWKWADVVEAATAEALEHDAGLLVVDSLADWAALQGDSENSSGAVLEALRPVQAAADAGLAVLLVRHDRKGPAAELGEAGRGSNATAGACDILMGLRKTIGAGHENRRRLDYVSRFDGLPPSQIIEWRADERTYALLGTEADIQHRACRESLLAVLPGDDPATEAELLAGYSEEERPPRVTFRRVLGELVDSGEAERSGQGKKGNPYRYLRKGVEYVSR
ncbi:MAG: AAA family ATPase [Thermoleophilia bacterium]|nr:AAA family ATPase [Thermoleophilia bacterium]